MQAAMKISILALSLLTSLTVSAPTPGPWTTDAISQCEAASNCETYLADGMTSIRFRAHMGPGSADYVSRFGSGSSNATLSTRTLSSRDNINTQIQFGDSSINFGSIAPDGTYGVYHHLYDFCHESTCDPSGTQVSSQFIVRQGSSWTTWRQLDISADAEYDGWDQRNAFVDAVVAAAGQGVIWSTERWSVRSQDGDPDSGTLQQAKQTSFINVAKYQDGGLQGYMNARVALDPGNGGWCGEVNGLWAAIASAVDPIAAGFFGVASAACQ